MKFESISDYIKLLQGFIPIIFIITNTICRKDKDFWLLTLFLNLAISILYGFLFHSKMMGIILVLLSLLGSMCSLSRLATSKKDRILVGSLLL